MINLLCKKVIKKKENKFKINIIKSFELLNHTDIERINVINKSIVIRNIFIFLLFMLKYN